MKKKTKIAKHRTRTLTVTDKDNALEIASGSPPADALKPGQYHFRRATRFARPEDIEKRNVKLTLSIRLDADIVEFFKERATLANAAPYQTQINAALRAYIENAAGRDAHEELLQDETFIAAVAERVRARV